MNTKTTVGRTDIHTGAKTQPDSASGLVTAGSTTDLELDAAIETLQAVVLTQKAQIDALLASLEGLLAALDGPSSAPTAQAMQKNQPAKPDASLLGNPHDPQFASLHQLMKRLQAS